MRVSNNDEFFPDQRRKLRIDRLALAAQERLARFRGDSLLINTLCSAPASGGVPASSNGFDRTVAGWLPDWLSWLHTGCCGRCSC